MQYQLNYLMSAEEVRDFLVEHKSELKSLADAFGVGYSTLRNYVYGQTPLESMPYRLLKAVTETRSSTLKSRQIGLYML